MARRKRLLSRDTEQWIFYNIGIPLVWIIMRGLRKLWKVKQIHPERATIRPAIFAIIHGDLAVGAQELPNFGDKLEVLASRSRDGWMVARYVHLFRRRTIRGSSSKGGESALRQMARRLKQGYGVVIPVDGPRGPEGEPAIGVIAIAAMTGAVILPCAVRSDKVWRFRKSWDRMMIAKPFANVEMHWGEPLAVEENPSRARMEELRLELKQRLAELHVGTK